MEGKRIEQYFRQMLSVAAVPLMITLLCMVIMFVSINHQYSGALQNANTAADFNKEFKNTIDTEMYNHVIRPRTEDAAETLPLAELDSAETVLRRLSETTKIPDNVWRIASMLNMCENLRSYMTEIAGEPLYDRRMDLLDRNIRGETGLTKLIETYMHDYIDDEVRELARLREAIGTQSVILISVAVVLSVLFSVMMVLISLRITRRITEPVRSLSEKAQRFGSGDLSPTPVNTDIIEFRTLDRGFDEMAQHINALMEERIADQKYLHRAELELLQAQINPHFLYNTLDSIVILAESHREEDVVNMVTSLSTFFRNSLSNGRDIISLEAERNHVASYLEIQQIRYSDILNYRIDIPEELLSRQVPKLILQPLVENALYHGIKNKRALGTITITGQEQGDDLLLQVTDNGSGMDAERLNALRAGVYEDKHTGLGLVNVHKRIRLHCGERYGLSFQSEPGQGTTVSILLPGHLEREV